MSSSNWLGSCVTGQTDQRGITLIEIMVALTLSLILTLGVGQIFQASRQTYRLQEAQGRLQENGRLALEVLAEDIRQAGYMGCPLGGSNGSSLLFLNAKSPPVTASNTATPLGNTITGYEGNGSAWPDSSPPDKPPVPAGANKTSDFITVQFAKYCGGQLKQKIIGGTPSPTVLIPATNTCGIVPSTCSGTCGAGDVLVLADCSHVEVFRASAVNGPTLTVNNSVNNNNFFTYNHNFDAEVMVYNSHSYFIQNYDNGEPTLYRQTNHTATPQVQPLVEGIEDMQIVYGVDDDDLPDYSVNRYVTADQVGDKWNRIVAVRIDLTLRSTGEEGDRLTDTQVSINPCTLAPLSIPDKRLRRCVSSTISLRMPLR